MKSTRFLTIVLPIFAISCIQSNTKTNQYKSYSFSEGSGDDSPAFTLLVDNGTISWSYTCIEEKDSGTLKCNPNVPADVIIAEFKAMAYWKLAAREYARIAESEENYARYNEYGQYLLSKCVTSLVDYVEYCPDAFKNAQSHYRAVVSAADKRGDELDIEVSIQARELNEAPLNVCDIYTTSSTSKHKVSRQKTHTFTEKYGNEVHTYTIAVDNGKLTWTHTGIDGKNNKTVKCNPLVPADVIISEFKAVVYWEMAGDVFYEMVEEKNQYSYQMHQRGKNMLMKCISCLEDVKSFCPGALDKAQAHYKNLTEAEGNGTSALMEQFGYMSYGFGEWPIEVCDIYFQE